MACKFGMCSDSGKLIAAGTNNTVVCPCAYGGRPPKLYTQAEAQALVNVAVAAAINLALDEAWKLVDALVARNDARRGTP